MKVNFDPISHIYTLDGVILPSVTQTIAAMGLYGDAANYFTEYSRDRGSYVHQIIHWYLSGELDEATIDESLLPYFAAWQRFEADTGFVSEITEQPMASEIYRFAGTPDHIGKLNGAMACIDVKTGAAGAATGIQLAGYELLYNRRLKRFALQLMDTGKYRLTEFKDKNDRGVFLGALAVYGWKQLNLRG